jgi:hypothetical protein
VQLMELRAIGPNWAWLLVMEYFAWRGCKRRQLGERWKIRKRVKRLVEIGPSVGGAPAAAPDRWSCREA